LQRVEIPLIFAFALATYPMMRSDGELSRREGALLLACYAALVAFEVWLMAA
jgi:cation:H+ antiporter